MNNRITNATVYRSSYLKDPGEESENLHHYTKELFDSNSRIMMCIHTDISFFRPGLGFLFMHVMHTRQGKSTR